MSEAFAQIRLSGGRSDHRDWSIHSAVSMARIDVGSSSRCAWTVLGQGVARHHFEFYWDGEVLWVADLRQTGGVTLNGVPLSKQWSAVVTGASIVFGEAHMSCVTSVPASGTRALPPFENEPTRHEIQMPDQLRDRPSFAEQEDRTADVFVPLRSKAPRSMVPPGPAGLSSGHSGPGLTGPPRSSNASPGRDPAGELEQLPEQKTMVFQPEQRSSNASSIRFGATKEGSDLPRFAPRSAASPQAHFDDSVTRIRAADSVSPSAPPIDMARTPRRSGGDSYSGADRDGARSLHTEPLSTARSPSVPPPASYPPSREAFGAGPRSEWFHRESQPHRSSTGFESDRGRAVESRAGARFADPPPDQTMEVATERSLPRPGHSASSPMVWAIALMTVVIVIAALLMSRPDELQRSAELPNAPEGSSLEEPALSPTEPSPTESSPTESSPTEPSPTEPSPTEPSPTESSPTESSPSPDPVQQSVSVQAAPGSSRDRPVASSSPTESAAEVERQTRPSAEHHSELVLSAVQALAAERDQEALRLYRLLAGDQPDDPSYATIAEVLQRRIHERSDTTPFAPPSTSRAPVRSGAPGETGAEGRSGAEGR